MYGFNLAASGFMTLFETEAVMLQHHDSQFQVCHDDSS